ncbi:MAG: DUF2510 domain-containing protein [Ilumatobacteraceae bacterium]
MSAPTAQAGWYPDPMGRYEYRYHNGVLWTADVSVGGTRFVDPAGSPSTPPVPGSQQPSFGGATRPKRGMAVAAFVIGLLSLLLGWVPLVAVLAAVGVVIALVFGIIGLRRSAAQQGYGRGFAITGIVLAVLAIPVCVAGFVFTASVVREVSAFVDPGEYDLPRPTCVQDSGTMRVEGTITNRSDRTRTYTVVVELSSGGSVSDSEYIPVENVAPGETRDWATEGVYFADDCAVRQVLGPTPFDLPAKDLNGN